MNRIRLITFDITGTILRFSKSVGEQYSNVGFLYGVEIKPEVLTSNFSVHWKRMNTKHPNFGVKTGITWHSWWSELVKSTFLESNCNCNDKELTTIADHLIKLYTTSECWTMCEGSQDVLRMLQNIGSKRVGIVSNFDDRLETVMSHMGILHLVDFIVTSYEAKSEKPDPKIFELALKKCGYDVKPHEAMHVGDEFEKDYVGALSAGWKACLVNSDPKQLEKITRSLDHRLGFENMSQLGNYLSTFAWFQQRA